MVASRAGRESIIIMQKIGKYMLTLILGIIWWEYKAEIHGGFLPNEILTGTRFRPQFPGFLAR